MANYKIYYVGTEDEVAHHAAPLARAMDIRISDPSDVVRLAKTNDLAIFFSEHFHRFRDAWMQLSKKGCNTLYAIDGILEWRNAWENRADEPACPWTMRPVLCDKVACIGASQARVLNGWGNIGKTEIVGIPRLEGLQTGKQVRRPDDGRFRVLVTTAKWPGFTARQTEQITQSLRDLRDHFQCTPQIDGRSLEVIWRLTGDLDQQTGVQNQLSDLSGKELDGVLKSVDAVITTPSTVMLEGMLSDLPVCLLDYTNCPRYVNAAWSITASDQIGSVMEQLVGRSDRRMFLQRSMLEDALQCMENSTDRLANLARQMIRIGHDCRSANQPVQFPDHILSPVGIGTQIDLANTFPEQSLIRQGNSEAGYIAVAAESLRRVHHLEARIELLESELSRAAEGFDRIASHPILAPLVKVRKIATGMGGRIIDVLSAGTKTRSTSESTENGTVKIKS